jgi:hypothetical protein
MADKNPNRDADISPDALSLVIYNSSFALADETKKTSATKMYENLLNLGYSDFDNLLDSLHDGDDLDNLNTVFQIGHKKKLAKHFGIALHPKFLEATQRRDRVDPQQEAQQQQQQPALNVANFGNVLHANINLQGGNNFGNNNFDLQLPVAAALNNNNNNNIRPVVNCECEAPMVMPENRQLCIICLHLLPIQELEIGTPESTCNSCHRNSPKCFRYCSHCVEPFDSDKFPSWQNYRKLLDAEKLVFSKMNPANHTRANNNNNNNNVAAGAGAGAGAGGPNNNNNNNGGAMLLGGGANINNNNGNMVMGGAMLLGGGGAANKPRNRVVTVAGTGAPVNRNDPNRDVQLAAFTAMFARASCWRNDDEEHPSFVTIPLPNGSVFENATLLNLYKARGAHGTELALACSINTSTEFLHAKYDELFRAKKPFYNETGSPDFACAVITELWKQLAAECRPGPLVQVPRIDLAKDILINGPGKKGGDELLLEEIAQTEIPRFIQPTSKGTKVIQERLAFDGARLGKRQSTKNAVARQQFETVLGGKGKRGDDFALAERVQYVDDILETLSCKDAVTREKNKDKVGKAIRDFGPNNVKTLIALGYKFLRSNFHSIGTTNIKNIRALAPRTLCELLAGAGGMQFSGKMGTTGFRALRDHIPGGAEQKLNSAQFFNFVCNHEENGEKLFRNDSSFNNLFVVPEEKWVSAAVVNAYKLDEDSALKSRGI